MLLSVCCLNSSSLLCRMFGSSQSHDPSYWQEDFEQQYSISTGIISHLKTTDTELDSLLATSHLLKTSLLYAKMKGLSTNHTNSLDVQKEAVSEVRLLRTPVKELLKSLQILLKDWPENPLLDQLSAICRKLLGTTFSISILEFFPEQKKVSSTATESVSESLAILEIFCLHEI